MKYKITIEELVETMDKYPARNTVYEQIIEGLNIENLVAAINTRPSFNPPWEGARDLVK